MKTRHMWFDLKTLPKINKHNSELFFRILWEEAYFLFNNHKMVAYQVLALTLKIRDLVVSPLKFR